MSILIDEVIDLSGFDLGEDLCHIWPRFCATTPKTALCGMPTEECIQHPPGAKVHIYKPGMTHCPGCGNKLCQECVRNIP